MFREDEGGHLIVNLDGYAIVPLEDYGKHTRRMHKAARVMGYRRDSDTRPKDGDAKQGSTRE